MSELQQLRQQLVEKDNLIAAQAKRIADLEAKVDLLIRQLYAPKSEKIDPAQLELLLGGDEPGKPQASAQDEPEAEANDSDDEDLENRKGNNSHSGTRRQRIPENLPIVEEIIEPTCVRSNPDDWRLIGEEVSERLDFEPGRFLRRRLIRRKYVQRSQPQTPPIVANLPPQVIEGGRVAPGLLAQITISKYCDHLPLYRQEQIFDTRHDVWIPRQTMARWMEQVGFWLQAIYREMHHQMLAQTYLRVDETPVRYLKPGSGHTKQGYLWTYQAPNGDTLYDWHASRAHGCLEKMIPPQFEGTLQCDGYSAYRTFAQKHGGIILAGCWAHARRKFMEARPHSKDAWAVLGKIQKLYRIEKELREAKASSEERLRIRQQQSLPVLSAMKEQLETMLRERKHLPQSAMGKAIRYTLELWGCLLEFTKDGALEIDNNLVENAIRPTALGKKNWLFFGSEGSGWISAVIYSVVVSCKNHGVEPHAYLKEVLGILPGAKEHEVADLIPSAWAARSLKTELAA